VRRARIVDLLGVPDELGRLLRPDRDDLIVLAVQDQRRNVELLEILGNSVSEKALILSYVPFVPAWMLQSQN